MSAGNAEPEPTPVRVVIADDHSLFRDGLAQMLGARGIDVAAQAADGAAAVAATLAAGPDVVLMDLSGTSGAEATGQIVERLPHCRVVVLTAVGEESAVIEAFMAGACGCVFKDEPIEEVVRAVQAAADGGSHLSPRIAPSLLRSLRRHEPAMGDNTLSRREVEVLARLVEGRSNREIGADLGIEESTVRNHVARLLMKLGVENRVQAAVRAVRDRMV
jgi:DNA-binding NarL/FixJ family response regulator